MPKKSVKRKTQNPKTKKVSKKTTKKVTGSFNKAVSRESGGNFGIPIPAKVISILIFVYAAFMLYFGFTFFIEGLMGNSDYYINQINSVIASTSVGVFSSSLLGLLTTSIIAGGIALIILGALAIGLEFEFWKGKNWARYVTVVIMGLAFVSSVISLDYFWIVLCAVIVGYLVFDKNVKSSFSKGYVSLK